MRAGGGGVEDMLSDNTVQRQELASRKGSCWLAGISLGF